MKNNFIIFSLAVGTLLGGITAILNMWEGTKVAYAENDDSSMDSGNLDSVDEDYDEMEIELPELYIKAVNPGYKVDGVNNVGEMIELARGDGSDTPISLAGTAISYTNSSGNTSTLFEFPEGSWMTGETILLRLASSPGSELAATTYKKTLAMAAGITLLMDGAAVDAVCWTNKGSCYKSFNSTKPTTLVRNSETGEFAHLLVYEPEYDATSYHVEDIEEEGKGAIAMAPQCKGLQFSEILSYYESTKSEQFVELYNAGAGAVTLDGCKLRYKNKNYSLSGVVEAEGYYLYYPVGFSLTKNPTNSNKLEIIDTDNTTVDTLEYPNGQRKGTAYALIGYDKNGEELWKVTYAPTPGAPNNYQEFKTCEVGKVINKETGNCVKATSVSTKICKDGYYLNLFTGRCKKNPTTTEKTCKEGYYLNPETNRCRKIQENKGADYSLEPENYTEESSFVALYAVLGVIGVGMLYLAWEFRDVIDRKFSLAKRSLAKIIKRKTNQK